MEKKDYKATLRLPETEFPMKANLPVREPEMLARWEKDRIHEKAVRRNAGGPSYILHDGPPYANGHIHIGHALNKILKDVIVKYKAMQGYYAPYVPGWDCHGLPIELEVDKKLGPEKATIGIVEKRRLCREYAASFVEIQKEEFKRLGVLGAWDAPYLTMTHEYQGRIAGELLRFVREGYVYKGRKPVHWCPSCVTALAEAEVEYGDKVSPSVFVRFAVKAEDLGRLGIDGPAYFIIWTTTPWTLPANLALAVHPEIEYAALRGEDGAVSIVATELLGALKERFGLAGTVEKTFRGADLLGVRARHPFIERDSPVVAGDFVTVEEGTGIVHIAPGHGEDDFAVGAREGLDILAPVDDHGKFRGSGVERIEGVFVFKANEIVLDLLREVGALLHAYEYGHSYPHCWRCKKPVIFRATEQWFISLGHRDLRARALEETDRVRWIPVWGKERIQGMIKGRPDWCISRQRAWGVPITVFTCAGCGWVADDPDLLARTEALIAEHGADVWYTGEADALLPATMRCSHCGGAKFEKETDILDVWFDSGVSHAATLTEERGLRWPADLYLEGQDQYRGWFQSSLLASVGVRGAAPYRTVLTHGFTVDGRGKKMSKSQGNVIAPQDIIRKLGAEMLRLWVSAEDYRTDVRISDEILARLTEAYRKIRNTCKFLLGNLADFDGHDYSHELLEIDRWAMSRREDLIERVTEAYENFQFHEVYHRLYGFCVTDMSSFYLDILKDRLYTFRADAPERRAAQWVLAEILEAMTRLMAPVLSFTAEEVWGYMRGEREESVFLASFPAARPEFRSAELDARWERVRAVRDEVNKALELKRREKFVGNSLEARVVLHLGDDERFAPLRQMTDFLPTLFIVSEVRIEGPNAEAGFASEELPGLGVTVERAPGAKCERCWNWSPSVADAGEHAGLCSRCMDALS